MIKPVDSHHSSPTPVTAAGTKPFCGRPPTAPSSYLKTGEGIQSDTNATIIAKLLALVEATKHPYILLGDWQNNPGSFTSTVLPSKFHFDIKATDHSILSGNVIDYALLHNTLASTTALTTDWAVPWRPHALLTLQLNIEAATKEYRQVQYFPPLPATPDIDFRPWTSYQSQAFEIELYGIPPNGHAQKWADWISCTKQYLLQEHPWAAQGRGASLRVIIKPLVSTKITTTWKKGKPAFWEQLQVRFQLAVKQPTEQLAALEQAWETTYYQLQTKQYPWYTVRGPMAAAITYLKEWGWQAANLMRWTRPEAPLLLSNELDMHQPWWKVEKALLHEAKNQRTNRLASRQYHHNLITGLDWHTYHEVKKTLPSQSKHHLNTWVQAAVQFREATKVKRCPLCQVDATPKHILRLCKWHKTQKHEPMPPEWMDRITSKEEEPLWSTGWIPLEQQEHRQQDHPRPWLLGRPCNNSTPTIQRLGLHSGCHTILLRRAHPNVGVRPVRSHHDLRAIETTWRTHRSGQRRTNQSQQGTLGRGGGPGQAHLHTSQSHCPTGHSLGGMAPTPQQSSLSGHP